MIIAGVLTLSPTSTEETKLEVVASDGKANSSISFKLMLCYCDNDGDCNWTPEDDNVTSSVGEFSVSTSGSSSFTDSNADIMSVKVCFKI